MVFVAQSLLCKLAARLSTEKVLGHIRIPAKIVLDPHMDFVS